MALLERDISVSVSSSEAADLRRRDDIGSHRRKCSLIGLFVGRWHVIDSDYFFLFFFFFLIMRPALYKKKNPFLVFL